MKPDSPFSKLPSLSELLNHPNVQAVVKRVNQTTIAQRAAGFWEELQVNWQGQGSTPSVGELAERLAKRLLGRPQTSTPLVNATGVICSTAWQAPLADAAVHEILRFAGDYQRPTSDLLGQSAASLTKLTGADSAWVANSFAAAVTLALQQCGEATIASSPLMGLVDPAGFGRAHVDTISDRLAAGAELVVVDGSGLLGGPRCGILVGKHSCVERVMQSELAPALTADTMVLAALEATLKVYRDPDAVAHRIPVLQLLSTPLENLKQRCERIAPLLEACDLVASAEIVPHESVWLDTGDSQVADQSWAIVLRPASGSADLITSVYSRATPQVVCRAEDDAAWLDFRAVYPRWDQHLSTALLGSPAGEASAPA